MNEEQLDAVMEWITEVTTILYIDAGVSESHKKILLAALEELKRAFFKK